LAQEGDEAHPGCHDILVAIAATLDKHPTCRRFVVQDHAEDLGICLDVHGICYSETDGSVGLEVAYLHSSKQEMTTEIFSALDAAGPAGQSMAVTAEPAAIEALLVELAAAAKLLSETDAARMQAALAPHPATEVLTEVVELLTVSRIGLLKQTAPRPLLTKAMVFRTKLDGWVSSKLKEWDTSPAFQRARKAQHPTRELYEASLKTKSQSNFKTQLATLK
jgi:hypothetical protein